ncbi:MAG: transporter, Spinster family, sphingosine-phosphate transporter [Gammaproteobacteria bacterium]|jgi:MFS family permease|nr:transporter, Spinster family, sphingosine-phosphate transporter [Gammaproteobacteria bacterium]
MSDQAPKSWLNSAGWGLGILSFINLFNYLDRYLVSALVERLKHSELALTDGQLGSLMSGFLAIYTLSAPVFGALGDRRPRPRLIAFGVACWSLATALSGLAGSYLALLAARASVGIGEAAYGTIAPSLLADYFPAAKRGRVMAIFFCAIPVGSALGYMVGGFVGAHYGWRAAFFVAGIPGLALALLCLWMRDPPRGSQDQDLTAEDRAQIESAKGSSIGANTKATYLLLLKNKPYVFTVLGYAAYTFAMGGLAYWMPAFLERIRGIAPEKATFQFGEIVVITGFLGTFIGGWLGDYFAKYSKQAYLWVSAAATLLAAPFVWFALTTPSTSAYLVCMVIAQLLMFLSTGPINASIVNLVLPTQRASAVALEVFAIHLLGDAISPYLIGAVSDASSLGQAVKIVPIAVVISGALWGWAAHSQATTRAHAWPPS